MTHTTLFDQNKLVFQKLDAIMNPVAFSKNEIFLEFSRLGYFFVLLVEIFYIPLVDFMYDLTCKVFFGPKFAHFFGLRSF